MAPPNSSSFSVSVVLPASGWEMMAKVRLRETSRTSSGGKDVLSMGGVAPAASKPGKTKPPAESGEAAGGEPTNYTRPAPRVGGPIHSFNSRYCVHVVSVAPLSSHAGSPARMDPVKL